MTLVDILSLKRLTLNCEKLADATTAAHDIARRRLSQALEKMLARSPSVIFEFTRANDKFEGFSGDKRAHTV